MLITVDVDSILSVAFLFKFVTATSASIFDASSRDNVH